MKSGASEIKNLKCNCMKVKIPGDPGKYFITKNHGKAPGIRPTCLRYPISGGVMTAYPEQSCLPEIIPPSISTMSITVL
jgi:hypothetical protein